MSTFTLYWLDGTKSTVTGPTVEQAFTNAGYGAGAARALDFYANGEDESYAWINKQWVKK